MPLTESDLPSLVEVTLDAAGIFLTRSAAAFAPLAGQADYLNPADEQVAGYGSLLGLSIRTTRRADAVKVAVTPQTLGRRGLGELVDRCHALASYAAARIAAEPELELYADPVLTSVVFRLASDESGQANARLRRTLLAHGRAVVCRTTIDGEVWLKLTLLNPQAGTADVDDLISLVVATAGTGTDR